MRKYLLTCSAFVFAASALIAGCGDNRDKIEPYQPPIEADFISGVVEAPNGLVAQLQPSPLLRDIANWLIPSAYAALTGIEPVVGAEVELVYIDDTGTQVGDVIDTAITQSNGGFTLIVPEGVEIEESGDLIVRVLGGPDFRGQVVRGRADINPYTELLLRRFINDGFDLSELNPALVAAIYTFIDDYELPVGASIEDTITQLETEVGPLLDKQIEILLATHGSASDVLDSYRLSEFRWAMVGDGDADHVIEQFSLTVWDSQWNLVDDSISDDGYLLVSPVFQDTAFSQLLADNSINFNASESSLSGSSGGLLSSDNILYSQVGLLQSLNGDYRRDTQPAVVEYQFSPDFNVFALPSKTDSEYFRVVDDDDEVIDPAEEAGDDFTRGLVLSTRIPTEASTSDLSGDFGRVAITTSIENDGSVEAALTKDEMNFDGIDTVTFTSGTRQTLSRTGSNSTDYLSATFTDTDGSYAIDENGNVTLRDTEEPTGFVNANFDFYGAVIADSTDDGAEEDPETLSTTQEIQWAVKRPSSLIDLTAKSYRLLFTNLSMTGDAIGISSAPFASVLDIGSPSSGTLNSNVDVLNQPSRNAGITRNQIALTNTPVTINLLATGELTMSFVDSNGDSYSLEGFLNAAGNLAILGSSFTPNGASEPTQLGLALLIETP
ncbi:hypothetical protein NBRC116494_07920 [Aurantivibrio plasticivorans]